METVFFFVFYNLHNEQKSKINFIQLIDILLPKRET